MTKSGQQ